MKRKSQKLKRVVLGVGHPWFSTSAPSGPFTDVQLTASPVAESILFRGGEKLVGLNLGGVGNWNKCRLVLEVLK